MTPGTYRLRVREDGARDARWVESALLSEPSGIREALTVALQDETTEVRMAEIVETTDGPDALPRLFYWLMRLQQAGQLEYRLRLSDGSDVHVVPQRAGRVFGDVRFDADRSYLASRFAFIRRDDRDTQIESPRQRVVLRFRSWLPAAVMAMFGQPASSSSIAERMPHSPSTDVVAVSELLVMTGFLDEAGDQAESASGLWDFHDALFHARSSEPRMGQPFAGQRPHRSPEPPEEKPAFPDPDPIALPPPRLGEWMANDPPLARVMEDRRSATAPGSHRLTLDQVGEFLYRTAHRQAGSLRALPSAGARHALEFYVAVHHVEGAQKGFYHYHVETHRLHNVKPPDALVSEILSRAATFWSSGAHTPDLVVVVASRYPRMAARYASIAYRNTLLDAGVAIEAMYLIATAMRLNPCALGINLPELFARMTGLAPFEETSIAMFALSGAND
jgi:SagB-type dehydrogenase family enzyme